MNVKNATKISVWVKNDTYEALRNARVVTGIPQSTIVNRAIANELETMKEVITASEKFHPAIEE